MLTSQTKDRQTSKSMDKLKEYGLNIDKMTDIDKKKPEELLYGGDFIIEKLNIKRQLQSNMCMNW